MKFLQKIKSWYHRLSLKRLERRMRRFGISEDLIKTCYCLGSMSRGVRHSTSWMFEIEDTLAQMERFGFSGQVITNYPGIGYELSDDVVNVIKACKVCHYPDYAPLYFVNEQRSV